MKQNASASPQKHNSDKINNSNNPPAIIPGNSDLRKSAEEQIDEEYDDDEFE